MGECVDGGADAWDGVLDRMVEIGDGRLHGSVVVDGWDGVVVIAGSGTVLMMALDGDYAYSSFGI